jgi:hypothetical protein
MQSGVIRISATASRPALPPVERCQVRFVVPLYAVGLWGWSVGNGSAAAPSSLCKRLGIVRRTRPRAIKSHVLRARQGKASGARQGQGMHRPVGPCWVC